MYHSLIVVWWVAAQQKNTYTVN